MSIEINAALGGPFELLGKFIERNGQEDSSGLRRLLFNCVVENDYDRFNRMCAVTRDDFSELWRAFAGATK